MMYETNLSIRIFQDIDIYTATKDDLKFDAPFHLQCKEGGKISGLCTYFNVEFNNCTPQIGFTTGKKQNQSTLTLIRDQFFL